MLRCIKVFFSFAKSRNYLPEPSIFLVTHHPANCPRHSAV